MTSETKDQTAKLRLTAAEADEWQQTAQVQAMTLSEFIRTSVTMAITAAEESTVPVPQADIEAARVLAYALAHRLDGMVRPNLPRRCPVCQAPRRADSFEDAMAHAQCDQIVAKLESEVVS
jgi:hypothetical protein